MEENSNLNSMSHESEGEKNSNIDFNHDEARDQNKLSVNIESNGKNNDDDSVQDEFKYKNLKTVNLQPKLKRSKAGLGVLLFFMFGILGLLLGICLYPRGTIERKTFIKGWLWTLASIFIFGVVLVIIVTIAGLL